MSIDLETIPLRAATTPVLRARCAALVAFVAACAVNPPPPNPASTGFHSPLDSSRLQVIVVADQAEAVLSILSARNRARAPTATQWERLFRSEGYVRLQRRERSLQRPFDDSSFQRFALSDTLIAQAPQLRRTLAAWRTVDPTTAARRAFAYLPDATVIRARIYPVIKPRTNSFVFEPRTNPAIFLYLDPAVSAAKFEDILAHELHHIGVGSVCPEEPADTTLSPNVRRTLAWMGGFAEGRAVLAAAGGPNVHPHATSDATERRTWDRDFAKAAGDLRRMESFYFALLDGTIRDSEVTRRGFDFIANDSVPQGAFYTLGWLMAATVENRLGRAELVRSLCDPVLFLSDYNRAVQDEPGVPAVGLPTWSHLLLERLQTGAPRTPH